jgi:hypothetical protein
MICRPASTELMHEIPDAPARDIKMLYNINGTTLTINVRFGSEAGNRTKVGWSELLPKRFPLEK